MISVELPDGRILDIETDDPQAAASAAKKFMGLPSAAGPAAGALTGASAPLAKTAPDTSPLAPIIDIPQEVAGAVMNAAGKIGDNLNPFSDARRASLEREANAPSFMEGMTEQLSRIGGVGSGLGAIPEMVAAPVTGAARSAIGHPYAAMTGMPYEEAKGAVDKAMMGMRAASVGPDMKPRTLPQKPPPAAEIKEAGSAAYKSPEVKSLELNPQSTTALSAKIQNELLRDGFRPSRASAPGVFEEVQRLSPGKGVRSVSADDIDSARKALALFAKEKDQFGKATPQAVAAQRAIERVDGYLDSISPKDIISGDAAAAQAKLKEARANWAAGSKAEEIDYRLSRAERQAAKSGSGSNIENALRQKIDQVSDYGLRPDERAMRDQIVMGTRLRDAMRTAGKLGVDGGLSLMLHGAMGFSTGGATLPVAAAGTIVRKLGERLTAREIKALNEAIRARSPLARSMPSQQMRPPSPLLSTIFPYGLPQALPLLMGTIPARAEDQ